MKTIDYYGYASEADDADIYYKAWKEREEYCYLAESPELFSSPEIGIL